MGYQRVEVILVKLLKTIILICVVAIDKSVAQQSGNTAESVQTFSFYTTNKISENFTNFVRNLSHDSRLIRNDARTVSSICTSAGSLWVEFTDPNFRNRKLSSSLKALPMQDASSRLNCRRIQSGESLPASIRFVGNSRLDKPGLSLYDDVNFAGEELYFEGRNLIYDFHMKSFGFTGDSSWTIYSRGSFTGESSCLEKWQDEAISTSSKFEFGIGSVRFGCHTNGDPIGNGRYGSTFALNLYYNKLDSSTRKLATFGLHFDGQELRLPFSRSFHSYTIMASSELSNDPDGKISWTIFSEVNFNGDSRCLSFNSSDLSSFSRPLVSNNGFKESNNHNYHTVHLMIGSIRVGCKITKQNEDHAKNIFQQLRNNGLSLSRNCGTVFVGLLILLFQFQQVFSLIIH